MLEGIKNPIKVVLENLRKKPITFNFPPEPQWTNIWRGRHKLNIEKCLGCAFCERVCPNRAITMVEREINGKKVKLPQIDYRKCSFCGLCVDNCPTKALSMTNFPIIVEKDPEKMIYTPERLAEDPKMKMEKTKIKGIKDWAISRSLWVINYFTGCGFTEAIPWVGSAYDMERFGLIAVPNPRMADLLIISGYVTVKTLKRILKIYEQMPNPKFVIAMGNCPMTGGTYWDSYHTIKRISDYIPVDLYLAGCPPRPEVIGAGIYTLINMIQSGYRGEERITKRPPKYFKTLDIKEEKEYDLMLGPQHPITGNFQVKLKLNGERIIEAKPEIGFLHRGFEKLMEYRTWYQNIMLVQRICVLDGAPYEIAYCEGVERIANIEIPERAKYLRVIQAELSRIQSHLLNLGLGGMAVGLDSFARITWGDREKVLKLLEMMSGGRLYQIYNVIGGVRRDVKKSFFEEMKKFIEFMKKRLEEYDNLFFYNKIVEERMIGIGKLDRDLAWEYGITGPNLRASGIDFDVRKEHPYEIYEEIDFDAIKLKEGDCYSRFLLRRREIEESLRILEQAIERIPEGEIKKRFLPFQSVPEGESMACVESARGELCFHIISKGGNKPYRIKVKGPTLDLMLSILPRLLKNSMLADFPVIYWSLDNCPADHDR